MIRSMTGYGEAERDTQAGRLRVEVKTVNHRYFSANVRLPSALDRFEPQVRDWVRASIPRGHISVSIRLEAYEGAAEGEPRLQLNEARARQYLHLLLELKERLKLPGEVDVALLSRFGDLIERGDEARLQVEDTELEAVVRSAARAAVVMREREGISLRADLEARLAAIEVALEAIGRRAPERLIAERDRLRRSVIELAEGVSIDEERLAREIAFMADRWDISEELVRLRSHLELFRASMAAEDGEPVGKRLGFLTQEMHRETNTIGSKSNDASIDHQVVMIKNEIERLREQIENVE
jgi:uncharacterized protein (TIGR00255 family)